MNKTKIVLMTTLLGSVLGLAACQSTTPAEQSMDRDHHRHNMQRAPLTPEQRAEWQAKREQRSEQREQMRQQHQAQRAQIEQACQGKRIGERVNVQWNKRVIQGTCEVRFTPDHSQFKRQANPTT
ncbi:heavy-metal resistance [Acinetobacter courvalinii]|uniref:heavy-metal resistance n=1 Tax=Acinetobacter courvalinii TaxID=280147 RepID=UPI0021CD3331|nr:heavy-metal resistance [Acinetobacter courvalinii]MCU4391094.1 heavy-metal resistance [Acinetobacter courvalinii]